MVKRIFDLVVASVLIIVLFPFMILVAFLVRFSMGSPVLFSQVRPGLHTKPFRIYKFRTMNNKTDATGSLLPDAERLTLLGKILRKLSIDELPQLINVIKGEMSFVGPRPLMLKYLPLYSPEQARRHNVKPGITGWAQINGRNAISWEEKFVHDVWYVDNQTFWLDIQILWLTVLKVLKTEGISQAGCETMPEFKGTGNAVEGAGIHPQ